MVEAFSLPLLLVHHGVQVWPDLELLMARLTGDAVTEAAQESLLIYITYIYSTSPLFLWQQVGIIFHILTGFCRFCSIYHRKL